MSNKKAMLGQVTESVLAEWTPQPVVVFIPITTTLSVPSSYFNAVEADTEADQMYVENLATEFAGVLSSVDIK